MKITNTIYVSKLFFCIVVEINSNAKSFKKPVCGFLSINNYIIILKKDFLLPFYYHQNHKNNE